MESARIQRLSWVCLIAVSISLFFMVGAPYRGEEGVYTITSMWMHHLHEYWVPLQNGVYYQRPPLFNWLIIPLADVLGWQHVLVAARIVVALASLGSGWLLFWLVRRLTQQTNFALLTTLVFFSGDLLFRRSWIAYADPVFAFFVFAAIAFTWCGLGCYSSKKICQSSKEVCHPGLSPCHPEAEPKDLYKLAACLQRFLAALGMTKSSPGMARSLFGAAVFFTLTLFMLSAAFLTKALTAYVFYFAALAVFYFKHPNGRQLLRWPYWLFYLLVLLVPVLWFHFIPHASGSGMSNDIIKTLTQLHVGHYLKKLLTQPLEVCLRLAPMSLLALWYAWKSRHNERTSQKVLSSLMVISTWIAVINFLPYWVAPGGDEMRYLLPLYPFFAVMIAYPIWRAGERPQRIAIYVLAFFIVMKYVTSFWGLPWFERMTYRYPAVAQQILADTQGHPLYVTDTTSTGLAVTATIDAIDYPHHLLHAAPNHQQGFVLSPGPDAMHGTVYKIYPIMRHRQIYLLLG